MIEKAGRTGRRTVRGTVPTGNRPSASEHLKPL